jgi:hypothetical protein
MLCWTFFWGHTTPQQQEGSYFLLAFKTGTTRGRYDAKYLCLNINWCYLFCSNMHQHVWQNPNLGTGQIKVYMCDLAVRFRSVSLGERPEASLLSESCSRRGDQIHNNRFRESGSHPKSSGVDLIKLFWSSFACPFCKQDHFNNIADIYGIA